MKGSTGYAIGNFANNDTIGLHTLIATDRRLVERATYPVTLPVRCQSCQRLKSVSPLSVLKSPVSFGSRGSSSIMAV